MPREDTQFKEGQSGNPNGRPPKGYSITETIREMMAEQPEIKKALGSKVIEAALKGDLTAIKLIWSYMDGQPKQSMDVDVESNQTITDLIGMLGIKKEDNE
jgi:hypothetical protein